MAHFQITSFAVALVSVGLTTIGSAASAQSAVTGAKALMPAASPPKKRITHWPRRACRDDFLTAARANFHFKHKVKRLTEVSKAASKKLWATRVANTI